MAPVLAMQPVDKQKTTLMWMLRSSEGEAEQMGIYKRGGKCTKMISLCYPVSSNVFANIDNESF